MTQKTPGCSATEKQHLLWENFILSTITRLFNPFRHSLHDTSCSPRNGDVFEQML